MGAPPRLMPRNGLARRRKPAPRNSKDGGTKRQPTRNGVTERKKERKNEKVGRSCWNANNDNGEAKRSKQKETKQNPGGALRCDGRQPLSAALNPPNPPSSIFEVEEVVKNRKVSFGESVGARN
jgi:hypothetical protein